MKNIKDMDKKEIAKLAAKLGLDIATTIVLVTTVGGTFTTAESFIKAGKGVYTELKFATNANGLKWMSTATTTITNGALKKIIKKF